MRIPLAGPLLIFFPSGSCACAALSLGARLVGIELGRARRRCWRSAPIAENMWGSTYVVNRFFFASTSLAEHGDCRLSVGETRLGLLCPGRRGQRGV